MGLDEYLKVNRTQVLALVISLVDGLVNEEDSVESRRLLVQSTYKALRMALAQMFEAGEVPGQFYGFHEGLAVSVLRPPIGKDLFGSFAVSAGLLTQGGLIPCPSDWPNCGNALPPFIRTVMDSVWRRPSESRTVTATPSGRVSLGQDYGNQRFIVDKLPDGEMWWRPIGEK